MNISLSKKLERFVKKKIRSGRFADASDVVGEALIRLQEDDEKLDDLRKEIAIGIDQLDRGEVCEFTAEDIMKEGRRILAKMKKKSA